MPVTPLTLLACAVGVPSDTAAPYDPYDTGPSPDREERDALARQLAGQREEFLDDEADELRAVGNALYWLEFPGLAPELHRWHAGSDARVAYTFSIGSTIYDYAASAELVVTPDLSSSDIVYRAYDATESEAEIGTATFDAPSNGTRWHAYAVDRDAVYVVVAGDAETAMYRWTPPGRPSRLWSFEELGYDLGEFMAFGVEDGVMVFIESGRIWRGTVDDGRAEWLGNETQVTGSVSFDATGVMWGAGDGALWFVDLEGDPTPVNLSAAVRASPWRLNDTYATAHHIGGDGFWRQGDTVVYEAFDGIWAVDVSDLSFTPLVLEDPDVPARWLDPVMLRDGTVFVTQIVSADGPVWRLDPLPL